MVRRLTTEEFIEKAKAVHGDRYDYSEVEYADTKTKVTIICRDHGPFLQTPNGHLGGKGCGDCAPNKPLTTETFIEKARAVHGGGYDYSQVEYIGNKTPVTIICPDHGPFEQTPNDHANQKSGCPDCGGVKRLTTKTFIEKAKAVHDDRYDYSQVEYVNNKTFVTIICPEHGAFPQIPAQHISKKAGCPDCAGVKALTAEIFIERAKAVHGDRYDYSQVKYINNRTPVTITCSDHGSFPQRPGHHLSGSGCPDCGGTKKSTTDQFIEKAKAIHGDHYDYSQVEYVNKEENVTILCHDHGRFTQTPHNHLSGQGCPDCARLAGTLKQRLTTDEFIEKAKAIHGSRYDYSQVEYVNTSTRVTIICPDHGPFEQTPNAHLAKKGCLYCAGKNATTDSFIEKARTIHGDGYDYSQVNYVSAVTKVTIICPDHGPFEQTPNTHLSKRGCPVCGDIATAMAKRLTIGEFIEKVKAVHGNRYDYSQVEYVDASTKVTIICPEHGPFEQTPRDHIHQMSGCPDCAETGFNPNDRGTLYYLAITTDDGDTRYKIGITNRTVEERFRGPDLARIRIVKTWRYAIGRSAADREAEILRLYAGHRYSGPDILQTGNTELFIHDILGLDT